MFTERDWANVTCYYAPSIDGEKVCHEETKNVLKQGHGRQCAAKYHRLPRMILAPSVLRQSRRKISYCRLFSIEQKRTIGAERLVTEGF